MSSSKDSKIKKSSIKKESKNENGFTKSDEKKVFSFVVNEQAKMSYEKWSKLDKSKGKIDDFISADNEYKNVLTDDLAQLERQLDQMAATNIGKIIQDDYRAFSNFDKFSKCNIFRYFYKTNPVLGRAIDLHVDLPLSKLKLTPPKNVDSEIVKDYIFYFYDSLFSKIDVFQFLRDFILAYRIHGEAFALVEDNYSNLEKSFDLASLENLTEIYSKKSVSLSEEDLNFVKQIDAKYKINPKDVNLVDRIKYLNLTFPYFNKDYKGVDRISHVPFYKIDEYQKNYSSNYRAVKIKIDPKLRTHLEELKNDESLLKELGITKGFFNLVKEQTASGGDGKVEVNNNPYKSQGNSSYVFEIGFDKQQTSLVNRVIDQSFEWEVLKSAVRTKISLTGKVGRIITAPGVGEEELRAIKSEIEYMSQNPDSEFVSNYELNITDISSSVKDDLKELIDNYDRLKEETAMGLGIPLSLIGGESQYSGEVIKLEIMNNEYLNFKNLISRVLEEYILKPVAIRKGFFKVNDWGDVELIYPSLTFSRTSLRSESQYDLLYNMYAKNSIPSSVIYEILNLDSEAVEKGLKKELFTIKNPFFGDFFNGLLSNASAEIGQDSEVFRKLREELGLSNKTTSGDEPLDESDLEEEQEDKLADLNFKSNKKFKIKPKKFERPDIKKNISPETSKKNKEPNTMKKLDLAKSDNSLKKPLE